MGGRIGCHVSLEEKVDGLVCLGYPLCAMGDRTKVRDEVLRALTTPIVFVQGTRDPFGTAAEIRELLPRLRQAELYEVAGADHSFKVPAKSGTPQATVFQNIYDRVAEFIRAR